MSRNNLNLGIQFQFFIVIQLQVVTFLFFRLMDESTKTGPGGLKSIKPVTTETFLP
jgi:hypothetical protein